MQHADDAAGGEWRQERTTPSVSDKLNHGLGIADFGIDGDGRPDILIAGRQSKNVVWYRQR
jgi:hypothetical protein